MLQVLQVDASVSPAESVEQQTDRAVAATASAEAVQLADSSDAQASVSVDGTRGPSVADANETSSGAEAAQSRESVPEKSAGGTNAEDSDSVPSGPGGQFVDDALSTTKSSIDETTRVLPADDGASGALPEQCASNGIGDAQPNSAEGANAQAADIAAEVPAATNGASGRGSQSLREQPHATAAVGGRGAPEQVAVARASASSLDEPSMDKGTGLRAVFASVRFQLKQLRQPSEQGAAAPHTAVNGTSAAAAVVPLSPRAAHQLQRARQRAAKRISALPEVSWSRVRAMEHPEGSRAVRTELKALGVVPPKQEAAMLAAVAAKDSAVTRLFRWYGERNVFRFVAAVRALVER